MLKGFSSSIMPDISNGTTEAGPSTHTITTEKLYELFHQRAQWGHTEAIRQLINDYPQHQLIHAKDQEGNSALHLAVRYNHINTVIALLEANANINLQNQKQSTPLHLAAQYCRIQILEILVEEQADLNLRDIKGHTPLHVAVNVGFLEGATQLIAVQPNVNTQDDEYQNTPLHTAMAGAAWDATRQPIVDLLLRNGADRKRRNCYNDTPESYGKALGKGYTPKKTLPFFKKPTLPKTDEGYTPLHARAQCNHFNEIQKWHAPFPSAINVPDNAGNTPLHLAARYNTSPETINILIELGSNLGTQNYAGDTPLHLAIQAGCESSIAALLQAAQQIKAIPLLLSLRNEANRTPFHEAIRHAQYKIAHLLIKQYHVDLNTKDKFGNTPLHEAKAFAQWDVEKYQQLVQLLIEQGADMEVKNDYGQKTDRYPEALSREYPPTGLAI